MDTYYIIDEGGVSSRDHSKVEYLVTGHCCLL